ncbi:GNAT family N-acetyltransferase [Sporomusa acidovorans]|uniref:N-acetyltransferase domain-containing protein n=1 Tax=Sporomusa acidovorans (strain ATCC 49682 / DSM 3132 / Mol) TaxID=1123286 RepID=A0ABZ3J9U0_SPOA4|nr:GNAT family N-acetyltransferase [Sporomusa acidovorans]OZC21797.1 GNAT acetyltransferase [Sporomusa acidovorans DSM 3132]SDD56638.1 GNAT acetyltransferase [Sporomusa acidovorans]
MTKEFFCYYNKYLGVNTSNGYHKIYACDQRNKPLARYFFQHLIIVNRKKLIFSIAPHLYKEFKAYIDTEKYQRINEGLIKKIDDFFKDKFANYSIRKMARLAVDNDLKFLQSNQVRQLTKDDKNIFLNSGNKANSKTYKENKWNIIEELVHKGRVFVYIYENRILSWAEISNIDFSGGNIVVNTVPEYRNLGYGKLVVSEAARWCFQNNVLPIYWVDLLNNNSLRLANRIGFKKMAEELVVSTTSFPVETSSNLP